MLQVVTRFCHHTLSLLCFMGLFFTKSSSCLASCAVLRCWSDSINYIGVWKKLCYCFGIFSHLNKWVNDYLNTQYVMWKQVFCEWQLRYTSISCYENYFLWLGIWNVFAWAYRKKCMVLSSGMLETTWNNGKLMLGVRKN